jgi:hypothetical protein
VRYKPVGNQMRNFLRRHIDYTTRMHFKRRARSYDYRFLLSVIVLAVAALLAIRHL